MNIYKLISAIQIKYCYTRYLSCQFLLGPLLTCVFIISVLVSSCGPDGCSEECNGPGGIFISCPGTREGCRAKKERKGCSKFSFNESKKACKVFDCPDNCFGFGIEIFEKEEFETDYSYVEIYTDPESQTQLLVEWLYSETEQE